VVAATPQPASPNLSVSEDLAKQCALEVNSSQAAPKFDFDQFQLLPEDRDVLDRVAQCVTSGPMRGKHLKLVGHADPRGTQEYNMSLGTQRAHTVREYLERLGVAAAQLAESTRGAIDARGSDEVTWRVDRRVDLDVAN
jgi:peptidoglycan-associated lipoprotein